MKNALVKIVREPTLLVGVVTATLGLLVLFGVNLSEEQTGGIVVLLGAVMALLRFVVTPSAEVAVQVKEGMALAGPAAVEATGAEVGTGDGEVVIAVKPKLLDSP